MANKLSKKRFKEECAKGEKKVTIYMNEGLKWMIEEIAHNRREPEKKVLNEILQKYWNQNYENFL